MDLRLRNDLFNIRRREWPLTLALSLFFFLIIAVFWVLKPIKKGALISYYQTTPLQLFGLTFGGAEAEQLAKILNLIVAYGVAIVFTLLVRRFERQQVIYIFCVLIIGLLAYFAFAISAPGAFDVWSFYVFGDIFNSIMVATFWAFSNDVTPPEASKRLYGLIGLGGVVGGAVGAMYVSTAVTSVGRMPLLLTCIGAMVAVAGIAFFVNRRAASTDEPLDGSERHPTMSAAVEGAKLVFTSRYLLAILAIVALYEVVSNIVEFQLSAMAEVHVASGTAQDAFFGTVGQYISVVSIFVQLFVTSFVMTRFGVGTALLVLPIADLLLSGGFLAMPTLTMVAALSVADNSLNYSITQSAKEALYTPTSRNAKYKAKAFIDMVVQRFAKVMAVVLNLAFAAFVGIQGVRWLSIASILVLGVWIVVVRFAGHRFEVQAAEEPEEQMVTIS